MDEAAPLSHLEKKLLLALAKGPGSPEQLVGRGGFAAVVEVMNAASWLKSRGLVTIQETGRVWWELGEEGEKFRAKGLPEKRALDLPMAEGDLDLRKLSEVMPKEEAAAATGV